MTKRNWHAKGWPATPMLAALISLGLPAVIHGASVQSQNTQSAHDSDITRQELALFDQFLDSHREIAEQVRQNPSLVNNEEFAKNHPALQSFMQQHPSVREELKENPKAFMHQEAGYDRREDERMRQERVHFNQFLDSHREIADQIRKNPKLINDEAYVKGHPELQTYLQDHPEFRETARKDPDAFTRADNDQYARQDNDARARDPRGDNDRDRNARTDNDNRDARKDNDNRDARADNDRDRDARADNDGTETRPRIPIIATPARITIIVTPETRPGRPRGEVFGNDRIETPAPITTERNRPITIIAMPATTATLAIVMLVRTTIGIETPAVTTTIATNNVTRTVATAMLAATS